MIGWKEPRRRSGARTRRGAGVEGRRVDRAAAGRRSDAVARTFDLIVANVMTAATAIMAAPTSIDVWNPRVKATGES
ncbi:hypothetical protein [Microbispora sp. GKU 823]|uniref:hypothetical protein n=1 Tax=Microbispora sp. GKU 823 TaxID=1652100 RepID=UPI00117E7E0C|nr:hypothetical protein [Microbispora sp. GKU 823]